MTFNKLNKLKNIFLAAALALTAFGAQAQLRLPANHAAQHNKLLADQKPATSSFKLEYNNRLHQDAENREAEVSEGVSDAYWNSDRVNPYGGVGVPDHKTLDVSGFVAPLKNLRVTSNYGYRASFGRMHYGVDLGLHVGDTVRSAFSGRVRLTKFEARGYGYYVVVRHDNGMETVYGHLSRFLVKPNQYVRAGEAIALGGNTGRSTGPHLHFETRYMGVPVNPAGIINFNTGNVHNKTYAFNRANSGKSGYAPAGKSQAKRRSYTASTKASTSKAAAKSATSSKRSKATKSRKRR